MASFKRTHHCAQLRNEHVDQTVSLAGWVNSYRDHGGVIFIDLRDREGITQIVFHPENAKAHGLADLLRNEDVIRVEGKCVRREEGMANNKLPTGEVEIEATVLEILNKSQTPPLIGNLIPPGRGSGLRGRGVNRRLSHVRSGPFHRQAVHGLTAGSGRQFRRCRRPGPRR